MAPLDSGGRAPVHVLVNVNGERQGDLPGKGEVRVNPGERLIFETPGGGGHGAPKDRDCAQIARDLAEGLISPAGVREYREDI